MEKDNLLPFNLQMFAEETDNSEQTPSEEPDVESTEDVKEDEPKTFTDEEVQKIVKERLTRERKKAEKDKAEVEKLAKMNNDQKKEYENQKNSDRADKAERELAKFKMQSEARKMFDESGISLTEEELGLVVTDEAESTNANVSKVIKLIERQRSEVTKGLLKGSTPKATGKTVNTMTKNEIMAIKDDFTRKQKMAENWELFQQ